MSFQDLGLNELILKSIDKKGYQSPTEIQAKTIPLLIDLERDFVGQARTGTGKTAAFLLPLLQRLDFKKTHIQSLVLVPTRELAQQVKSELDSFSSDLGVSSVAVYGGASYTDQIRKFKKEFPQIVVATPGRLMDLLDRGVLDLSQVDIAILDEADEMLNMGFLEDVREILSSMNEERKMWMFSATLPPKIQKLVKEEFNDPVVIKASSEDNSKSNIEQFFYLVKTKKRELALERLLAHVDDFYGAVFCQTREEVKNTYERLRNLGFDVFCLHGEMSQRERSFSLGMFKKRSVGILICTDVAARGIDIDNLNYVINLGLPQGMEAYTHRIGRTGRAGKKGTAYTIITPGEFRQLKWIEQKTGFKIPHKKLPNMEETIASLVDRKSIPLVMQIQSYEEVAPENRKSKAALAKFREYFETADKEDLIRLIFDQHVESLIQSLPDEDIEENNDRMKPLKNEKDSGGRRPRSRPRSRDRMGSSREGSDSKKSFSGERNRSASSKDGASRKAKSESGDYGKGKKPSRKTEGSSKSPFSPKGKKKSRSGGPSLRDKAGTKTKRKKR